MREMKDSGIEWIGEIPKEWKICRIKELFHEVNERCDDGSDYTLLSVSEYYGVAPRASKINDDDLLTHSETLDGYKVCHKHDIVMNIMLAWKGSLGLSEYVGIVSPAYCVYRANMEIDEKYFHYLFRTDLYTSLFKQFSTGIIDSRLRLYPDKFLSLKCQVPPLSDQHRIADYLDDKCGKIDRYIEQQKQVIEKLKAYKQSVITEAVTKGLDPTVPMKDSGVEWIGEIPDGWEVVKAKYCILITNGSDPKTQGDTPVYGSGSSSFKTCGEFKEGPCVLIGRKGATLHIPHYIEGKYWNVDTAFDVKVLDRMELKYYYYLAICFDYKIYMSQTTLPSMTQTSYENMMLPIPSDYEQRQITNHLDKKCFSIDSAIKEKQTLIEKLTEYKKSLIYEVVTGKKEV